MVSSFGFARDVGGYNTFGLPVSKFKYATVLVAGVEQQVTLPATVKRWLVVYGFSPGATVMVAVNNTATIPTGSFAITDSEPNPVAREVSGGDTLHFIAGIDDVVVGVSLYALQ